MSMEANNSLEVDRMGSPRQLAELAAHGFEYPNWIGRHPWLAFVVTPFPIMIALVVCYGCAFASLVPTLGAGHATAIKWGWLLIAYVPSLYALCVSCGWVVSQRTWTWLLPSVISAMVFDALFCPFARISDIPGQSQIGYGFGPQFVTTRLWLPLAVVLIVVAMARVRARIEDAQGIG